MRTPWRSLTRRGHWLVGIGLGTVVVTVLAGQRDLLRVGLLLLLLPLLSALVLLRSRYRLSIARGLAPERVPIDGTVRVAIRVQNLARLRTGVLLVQDELPWQLGTAHREVLDAVPPGAYRDLTYEIRATVRGRHQIGPLQVSLVDPFGLCRTTRRFAIADTVTVVPRTVPLPTVPLLGDWSGVGESRSRALATSGDDDVVPREYRTGDELRRVHWKSTARAGELMVRQEELPFRTRATVLLDTRAIAHRGEGLSSSFEWAVTAAASVAIHLVRRGYAVRLLDLDGRPPTAGPVPTDGPAEQSEPALLDALAVVAADGSPRPALADPTVREHARDGLVVLVAGTLDDGAAATLARLRRGASTCLALLADVEQWPGGPSPAPGARPAVAAALALLAATGWRCVVVRPTDDLATAWRSLARGRGTATMAAGAAAPVGSAR